MTKVRSFEDLIVWQRAMDLATEVYRLTRAFPKEELFGLTNQLRRAAVSVSSNIAEGQARETTREFTRFLHIARGSNAEVRSQLLLAQRLNLASEDRIHTCLSLVIEISKMINSLLFAINNPTTSTH